MRETNNILIHVEQISIEILFWHMLKIFWWKRESIMNTECTCEEWDLLLKWRTTFPIFLNMKPNYLYPMPIISQENWVANEGLIDLYKVTFLEKKDLIKGSHYWYQRFIIVIACLSLCKWNIIWIINVLLILVNWSSFIFHIV